MDSKIKFTKVKIPTELSIALAYVASVNGVRRQILLTSLLAQSAMIVAPEVARFQNLPAFATLPKVPNVRERVNA